jgi:hypothetical protein
VHVLRAITLTRSPGAADAAPVDMLAVAEGPLNIAAMAG